MVRWLIRALAILVIVALALVVLDFAELFGPVDSKGNAAMAPTIPACNGRAVAEGFTYTFRDPRPGEIVAVHAAETEDGRIVPDADARDLVLLLRVAAGPEDEIVSRNGTVFVDEIKFDDIRTDPFPLVTVPNEQYFLLGDNRAGAIDSRTFGPVLPDAIFGRVFFVTWPFRDVGRPESRHSGPPPGEIDCD